MRRGLLAIALISLISGESRADYIYYLAENKVVRYDLLTDSVEAEFGFGFDIGHQGQFGAAWPGIGVTASHVVYARGHNIPTSYDSINIFSGLSGEHQSSYAMPNLSAVFLGPNLKLYGPVHQVGAGWGISRFNASDGSNLEPFIEPSSSTSASRLTWLQDGRMLLADGDPTIRLYDPTTGDFVSDFAESPFGTSIGALAESSEGVIYAASMTNQGILKFDTQTGAYLGRIDISPGWSGTSVVGEVIIDGSENILVKQGDFQFTSRVISRYNRFTGEFIGHLNTGTDYIIEVVSPHDPVPEPASLCTLALGVLAVLRRRKAARAK